MLISTLIVTILLQISCVVSQSVIVLDDSSSGGGGNKDEVPPLEPSITAATATVASSASMMMAESTVTASTVAASESSHSSISSEDGIIYNQSNENDSIDITMWTLDLFNNFMTSGNFLVSTLYDYNAHYLSSAREHVRLVYQNLAARSLSVLALTSKSDPLDSVHSYWFSRASSAAFSYHLYWLQTILFRAETMAVLCLLAIGILFFHSQRRIIAPGALLTDPPLAPPATTTAKPLCYLLALKVLRCLNFTILFANIFAIVDATFRQFRNTDAVVLESTFGNAAVYSIQGRRPNMEDCFTLKNNISKELGIEYFAVFDGHGGQNAALYSEKEIFDGITKRIRQPRESLSSPSTCPASPFTSSDSSVLTNSVGLSNSQSDTCAAGFDHLTVSMMKNILHEEVTKVDRQLVEEFRKRGDISGSTALIAVRLVHSNILLVANVGDSRAIMCDWKGATIPLSFDHKPYQLKEYRRIVEAGGYIMLKGVYRVNGILAVSRALGDYPLKEDRLVIADPDILTFDLNELKPRFMIMASDGFWDTFSNDNAVRFVRNEMLRATSVVETCTGNLALYIAKKLVNEAYTRESYDNITVIVILFDVCDAADNASGSSASSSPSRNRTFKIGQATLNHIPKPTVS